MISFKSLSLRLNAKVYDNLIKTQITVQIREDKSGDSSQWNCPRMNCYNAKWSLLYVNYSQAVRSNALNALTGSFVDNYTAIFEVISNNVST